MTRMMGNRWLVLALCAAAALPAAGATGSISGAVTLSGGGSRLAVVYVEKGPEAAAKAAPAEKEMAQQDTEFRPEVIWVRAGDTVKFVNRDNFYHNVFSSTSGNDFDLGLYRGGVGKTVELARPGEIDVYCNIHPNMKAKMLVVPDARAAEVAPDGTYTLSGLAPGDYTVVAWSASHEPVRREVRVRAGEPARADFNLKARGAVGAHLNKNGEQYGRYR
jgi:plastocyanin